MQVGRVQKWPCLCLGLDDFCPKVFMELISAPGCLGAPELSLANSGLQMEQGLCPVAQSRCLSFISVFGSQLGTTRGHSCQSLFQKRKPQGSHTLCAYPILLNKQSPRARCFKCQPPTHTMTLEGLHNLSELPFSNP